METESTTIQKAADLLGKLRDGIGQAVVGQAARRRRRWWSR